jgi:hypothetical protein
VENLMPDLAVLAIGQSNARGVWPIYGGDYSIPANCMTLDNDENRFGRKFVPMALGTYPLNVKTQVGDPEWANNLALSFCREAAATWNPRLVMVAKGSHRIECFIKQTTRKIHGWKFKSTLSDLAPYIFNRKNGVCRALEILNKKRFDVVVFHQGEANGGMDTKEYEKRFVAFTHDLIKAGIINAKTPIIVGGLLSSRAYYAVHKATIKRIASRYPQVKFVDSDGLTSIDGTHFDGPSITTFGQRYWAAFEAA